MTAFRTGMGASWLDFLLTRLDRYRSVTGTEMLTDVPALRAWLAEHEMLPTGTVTEADLLRARELREALHRAAVAALSSSGPAAADVRLIESVLAADRPVQVRRWAGALRVVRPASADEALARLARQAVTDLAGPHRALLRPCGDDTCSGIFLDHTGRRRWCADERCGVRARVRAHRARARSGHGA